MILSDLLLSLEPLVNLWMSALILDELIGARDIKRLVLLVLVTVALTSALSRQKCAGEPPSPSKQNDGMGEGERGGQ